MLHITSNKKKKKQNDKLKKQAVNMFHIKA